MILDIIELLKRKDSNFRMLFDQISDESKVDLKSKIEYAELNKYRKIKTANCTMKYNREILGIEMKVGDYLVCICAVDDSEMKEIVRFEDQIKFAYIKTIEHEGFVEYDYNLIYKNGKFMLMPTVCRQGQTSPRFSSMIDVSDEDIDIIKNEKVIGSLQLS